MKDARTIFLLVTGCWSLVTGCSSVERPLTEVRPLMGTFVEIKVYEGVQGESATAEAFSEIERIENLLSKYKGTSEVSRINRDAATAPVRVSPETLDVIKRSIEFSKRSAGAFDITVGPLVRLWGFADTRDEGRRTRDDGRGTTDEGRGRRVPAEGEITETLQRVGYENLQIDEENKTVRFKKPGMEIDLGGVGKGYAVDRAIEVLRSKGVERAMVDVGGNLRFLGLPERGYWVVGIKDPRSPERLAKTIKVKEQGVSTSGSYEKYLEISGKRYCHIIDPRNGYPLSGVKGTTVVAPTAMEADAASTTVFILGEKNFRKLNPSGSYDIIEMR